MGKKDIKMVNETRWADGQLVYNRLNEITHDPMNSQEEFVMRLVRENARTVYGQQLRLSSIHSLDDFRRLVPLSTYEDYSPYIERIVSGERNILTAYLTEHFSLLSGYKKLPVSRWDVQAGYDYRFCSSFYIAGCRGLLTDGMTLNLVENNVDRLPTGVAVGNLLRSLLVKRKFNNEQVYVIPIEPSNTAEPAEVSYKYALCALSQREVSLAMCEHYTYLLDLLRYIEKHWPRLADDIEQGNAYVRPDAGRAQEVRQVMEEHHIGTELVPLLWPTLRCIMVFDVDNLSAHFEMLRTYCGTQVHFLFTGISSPEGTISTAIHLDDPQTVLIPDALFYEFKPSDASDYNHLLTLNQLEIGKSYELIITNLSGLYRYKTHKTLLVVGHYHDTPTVIIEL